MNLEFSQQILEKQFNVKFHQNPSSWDRGTSWRWTDMTKLIVAVHCFANAPKIQRVPFYLQLLYTKHTCFERCELEVRIIFQETLSLCLSLSPSLLSLDTIKLTLPPRTICCQHMIYTSYEFGVDSLHINKIQYHEPSGELR